MYRLKAQYAFSAAHKVTLPDGTVERIHGHNWKLEAVLASETLDRFGMVADFEAVKSMLKDKIGTKLDHAFLNETGLFPENAATCENVAKWIYGALAAEAGNLREGLVLESVTLWESPGCGVTYSE